MNGYDIERELYTPIGHKSIACTLVLQNGYEVTGTYCRDTSQLIYEDTCKQMAFKAAYQEYSKLRNAIEEQLLFTISFPVRRETDGKEPIRGTNRSAEEIC